MKSDLSTMQERVAPKAGERPNSHTHARQFYFVPSGAAAIAIDDNAVSFGTDQSIYAPALPCHRFASSATDDVVFSVTLLLP